MFTGLIQGCGTVRVPPNQQRGRLVIDWPKCPQVQLGDSIAIDGVCLTLVQQEDNDLHFDVGHATRELTTLGQLQVGAQVHMEPALCIGDRLGGHFVTGHVDGLGTVSHLHHCAAISHREEDGVLLDIAVPKPLMPYLAAKGSVAIAGVSLTIYQVLPQGVRVNLIPHTWAVTHFHRAQIGSTYNVEVDMLARYVLQGLKTQHDKVAYKREEHHGDSPS